MLKCRVSIVLLVALAFSQTEARAADWMRLRSANFTVEGDVSEGKLREVARRLEAFREVIERAFPSTRMVTSAPVTVVVFARDRDFKTVSPRFEGKPIAACGHATDSPFGASIAISAECADQAYSIAYHEFGHLLISNAFRGLPVWVNEGLAEFYGTFDLSDDGRRAVLGNPLAPEKISLLRQRLLPLSELLAVTRESRLFNVSVDRGRFYAQSWALVHYFLLGKLERGNQFRDFLRRLGTGAQASAAFAAAFPDAARLDSELKEYVWQFSVEAIQVTFAAGVARPAEYTVTRMTVAEAIAVQGFELATQRRFDEARARFEQALNLAPDTASAQTGLGLVLTLLGKQVEALPHLRRGTELADGDALAHFAFGYGVRECVSADCETDLGRVDTARREFRRAVDILPQFPEALAQLAWTEGMSGRDPGSAERHLLDAIAFLPGREDYRLTLAQIYVAQKEFAKAEEVLGPIAEASPSAANKAAARQVLDRLAQLKNRVAPGLGNSISRELADGEHRTEGTLEVVECTPSAIVMVVRDATGVHRFGARSLRTVKVTNHSPGLTRLTINCGPQRPSSRIVVTWRPVTWGESTPEPGLQRLLLAIEVGTEEK